MTWYEKIVHAHLAITSAVSHSERMKSDRYFVWQEDGNNDLTADGVHVEHAVTGSTDLYTKQEFDPWADELGESFDNCGISWRRFAVVYEEETGFYHHSWDWGVA